MPLETWVNVNSASKKNETEKQRNTTVHGFAVSKFGEALRTDPWQLTGARPVTQQEERTASLHALAPESARCCRGACKETKARTQHPLPDFHCLGSNASWTLRGMPSFVMPLHTCPPQLPGVQSGMKADEMQ